MGERTGKICFYCTHCGDYTFNEDDYEYLKRKCYYCGSDIKEYDMKYFLAKYNANVYSDLKDNQQKEFFRLLYEDFIVNKSDFDLKSLMKRIEDDGLSDDLDIIFDKVHPLITAECPYCHSKDTKKISTTGRLISFGFFGFGSSKINGKQWHCNICKSDF